MPATTEHQTAWGESRQKPRGEIGESTIVFAGSTPTVMTGQSKQAGPTDFGCASPTTAQPTPLNKGKNSRFQGLRGK